MSDDQDYDFDDVDDDDEVEEPKVGMAVGGALKRRQSKLLAKQRQRSALELRKAGATYAAIAEQLGYSHASGARAAVIAGMGEIIQEPAQELRTMQYERLNHMLLVIWRQVQDGDMRAIDQALRIMDKMDRLMGTEAPQKSEVDISLQGAILVADVNSTDYIAAMQRMAEGIQHNGNRALPAAQDVGSVDDIIEAEVVEAPQVVQPKPKQKRPISMEVRRDS